MHRNLLSRRWPLWFFFLAAGCNASPDVPVTGPSGIGQITGAASSCQARNGQACDDGSVCTINDTCHGSNCTGTAISCDDGNPCTTDTCNATTGCVHTVVANGTTCSDGNACTTSDTCQTGTCTGGAAPNCNDNNVCTTDSCNTSTGCVHANVANGTTCSDGNACTTSDTCQAGTCTGGAAPNCNDSNACTTDSCNTSTGCVHVNVANGTTCSDGNACTTSDTCQTGTCTGGAAPNCNDNNACTTDSCNTSTGCVHTSVANGTTCSDGNACTTGDTCQTGTCKGGAAPDCDDRNGCTTDSCNTSTGCVHASVANGSACSDGSACTTADACQSGTCIGGAAPNCDDNNVCTTDSCDTSLGCLHVNANGTTCSDGNACTTGDTCQSGTCAGGAAPNCDDGNAATVDACVPSSGCTHTWTAPAQIVLNAFGAGDLNPRRPLARLTFSAVGNYGLTGTAASYDVRYSKKPIVTAADFAAACSASALPLASIPAPAGAGTLQSVVLEGPDERLPSDPCKFAPLTDNGATQYSFAIQVTNTVGAKSPVSAALSTDGLRLRYARLNLGGIFALPTDGLGNTTCATAPPGSTCDMQERVAMVGDLDGDGFADMAVGGGLAQPLCIIYGRASAADGTVPDIDLSAMSGPDHICIPNLDANGQTGLGAPIAKGRDVNGDGVTDLVVGSGAGTGGLRSAQVYLGRKNAKIGTVPAVVIHGLGSIMDFGAYRVSTIGNFNGDTSPGGVPLNDIALTSRPNSGVTYDRVYIVPGNAAWVDGATLTINLASATDRAANNVATIQLVDSASNPIFGFSLLGVGNVLLDNNGSGSQYDDLAIAEFAGPQQVVFLKGQPLVGDTQILLSRLNTGTAANDAQAVRFVPDGSSDNAIAFFMDVVEFDGDPRPDLVIQHQSSMGVGALYWLYGKAITGKEGKTISVYGASVAVAGDSNMAQVKANGWGTAMGYYARTWLMGLQTLGNFADRPSGTFTDVVYGRPQYAASGGSNLVNIRYDLMRPSSPIPTEMAFEYDDLSIADPFKPTDANWGVMKSNIWGGVMTAPLGDFNGDGLVDLAIGSVDGQLVIVY